MPSVPGQAVTMQEQSWIADTQLGDAVDIWEYKLNDSSGTAYLVKKIDTGRVKEINGALMGTAANVVVEHGFPFKKREKFSEHTGKVFMERDHANKHILRPHE